MLKVIIFSAIFGMAVSLMAFGEANAEIPKGVSRYKFKNPEDISQLFKQVNDMGLSQAEVQQLFKIMRAAAQPGATALTLENNAPQYTLTFAGVTVEFENEKTVPYKFLNRTGSGVYTVSDNNITGTNTLDTGAQSHVTLLFTGDEVLVSRMTKTSNALISLEKVL